MRIRVALSRERLEVLEQQGMSGRDEQLERLELLAHRALALCVGRGMLTMSSLSPVLTKTLPIPLLCIDGIAPQTGLVHKHVCSFCSNVQQIILLVRQETH